jgi:hypothetical protein
MRWAIATFPPGTRAPIGLLFMVGGVLAILPVFGLWMLPVGVAILWLDMRDFRRWRAGRRVRWLRGARGRRAARPRSPRERDALGE